MKRKHNPRRRDRKTGLSPYERHAKRETQYSPRYLEWFAAHRVGGKREAVNHAAR